MSKKITTETSQTNILKQFRDVLNNGGEFNLETKTGFIYAIGGPGAILCKFENGIHYSYQLDKNKWVEL